MNVYDPPCSVLNAEQSVFLRLHARRHDPPYKWRWIFHETSLRAYTESGRVATITRALLNEMIAADLMARGPGCADVIITDAGRSAAK